MNYMIGLQTLVLFVYQYMSCWKRMKATGVRIDISYHSIYNIKNWNYSCINYKNYNVEIGMEIACREHNNATMEKLMN